MSRRSPEDVIGAWLEEGPFSVSTERRGQMLGNILTTPQKHGRRTWLRERSAFSPINLAMGVAAAIVLVIAGALGLMSLQERIGGPPASSPTPARPSPSIRPVASIDLGYSLNGMVLTTDAVWVGSPTGITSIDPQTNQPAPEITVSNPHAFAVAFGSVWVVEYDASVLRRVDPASGVVLAEIPTGTRPDGITVTDDAVWVLNRRDGTITRVDPDTNAVAATIELGPAEQGGWQHLVASGDSVWVGSDTRTSGNERGGLGLGSVVRIDAVTSAVVARTEDVDVRGPLSIFDGRLWTGHDVIDLETGEKVGSVNVPDAGEAFRVENLVWISGTVRSQRLLFGIDPATFRVEKELPLESYVSAAAVGFNSVWLEHDNGVVTRWAPEAFR